MLTLFSPPNLHGEMKILPLQKKYFTKNLMQWHEYDNDRTLPWKTETDPYKIWLSEIIMQQTRVEQGQPYYERFVEKFATVKDLASASQTEVFRLWQGLGYYNRCKNLLETAHFITTELSGKFPDSYEEVLQLKGVGAYTAAAIVSFAYRLPYAVVDGNVQRVLARFFGIDTPVDTTEGKKLFQSLAQELIDKRQPHHYNQAIMDFGAVICKPVAPLCEECILRNKCVAKKQGRVSLLPNKAKKTKIKKRFFHFILFRYKNEVWIQQRMAKDIWQHLHQPYLIETDKELTAIALKKQLPFLEEKELVYEGKELQKLSHQSIVSHFFSVALKRKSEWNDKQGDWISINDLKKIGFSKTIVSFFEKKGYF